jgi:hypothetical protein
VLDEARAERCFDVPEAFLLFADLQQFRGGQGPGNQRPAGCRSCLVCVQYADAWRSTED